jgi:hypothetical protein
VTLPSGTMLPLAVTLVVAALLGLSFFIHPIWLWFNVAPEKLSNDPERESFFQYFSTDPEFFAFSDATTSDWLLGEAKSLCAQKIDAIKAYEAKATTQFSIVGSGIGVLTVVGGADLHRIPGQLWLVAVSAFLLFCSLAANIVCITRGRIDALPYVDVYNYFKTLRDPRMKARAQYSLIEGYVTVSNDLAATCLRKQRMLAVATTAFVLGLAVVVGNYFGAAADQKPPEPTQVRIVR